MGSSCHELNEDLAAILWSASRFENFQMTRSPSFDGFLGNCFRSAGRRLHIVNPIAQRNVGAMNKSSIKFLHLPSHQFSNEKTLKFSRSGQHDQSRSRRIQTMGYKNRK